jgi:hypothetical protein
MDLGKVITTWQRVSMADLKALNAMLTTAGKPTIAVPSAPLKTPTC